MRLSKLIAAAFLLGVAAWHAPASSGQAGNGYASVVNYTGHSIWVSLFTVKKDGSSSLVRNGCLDAGSKTAFQADVRHGLPDTAYAGWTYWIDVKSPEKGCAGANIEPSWGTNIPSKKVGVYIFKGHRGELY